MKRHRLNKWILLGIIITFILSSIDFIGDDYTSNIESIDDQSIRLAAPFELTRDFEASTKYISPESSPGSNDGLFFSFKTNKDGNFSININNFPSLMTDTIEEDVHVSFCNPSGTDLWYISYVEMDIEREGLTMKRFGNYKIKFLKSEDKGQTWEEKTVATFTPSGSNYMELIQDLSGSAIAANPSKGIIGIVTWYNTSELKFICSMDNGTTWNDPINITTAERIGSKSFFNWWKGYYPGLEIGILKNSTIYVISQINNATHTPYVYFESHDNGTIWSGPKNITITAGQTIGLFQKKLKMQVDHDSGNYWLMWMHQNVSDYNITWAEFDGSAQESLYTKVNTDYLYYGNDINFDFLYDSKYNLFRVIQVHKIGFNPNYKYEVFNLSCSNFGSPWVNNSMGYHDALDDMHYSLPDFNIIYDGDLFQFFFQESYTGIFDIYQYYCYTNSTFWRDKGFFEENRLAQVFWNGRINNTIRINITTVIVDFQAQNNTDTINRTIYISIDNEVPSFQVFTQNRQYFNPLSSNITLTEIPWDLLASEECTLHLEIFKQGISLSDWQKVTDNNLNEMDPQIFRSDRGQLYILYETIEFGTRILYLVKSNDNGVTWSSPVEIMQVVGESSITYSGAAWGDIVVVCLWDPETWDWLLYRSFDQGETFEEPIDLSNLGVLPANVIISKTILTRNGTLFITYKEEVFDTTYRYTVLRSNDLGFNWITSLQWNNHSANFTKFSIYLFQPDLAYDSENDLLHVVMPFGNRSMGYGAQFQVANYSFATLNLTTNTWGDVEDVGVFQTGFFSREPKLLINRDPSSKNISVRAIYLNEMEIIGGRTNLTYKEIISTDLGKNWSGPTIIITNNVTTFTSSIDDIFYVSSKSDGNDYEVYFCREGSLILTKQESLSPAILTEVTFDGIDDFGEYISEGNYTYNLYLRDDAGNQNRSKGWFYADYNAPQIIDHTTNWTITPIPRYDVNITVNITDNTGFSAYLYYKRDFSGWNITPMINVGGDIYSAVIPRDNITDLIQYYIKGVDLAGNVYNLDRDSLYYTYDMPRFYFESEGLFDETESYSSGDDYSFTIEITHDLEYVSNIYFQYSFDEGDSWDDLELQHSSPKFSGTLEDIPGDLRELYYQVILIDIFGNEYILTDVQKVEFYPEVPSVSFNAISLPLTIIMSALVGFVVAYGYIKLKGTSHQAMYKQIFIKELARKTEKLEKGIDKKAIKEKSKSKESKLMAKELEGLQVSKIATPFSNTYFGILIGTITVFLVAIMISGISPQLGILLLILSLLMSVFGYMILMSRDITINVYLEKISKKNMFLEMFQIFFMFVNILMILSVGFLIDWFRYYLIESTFDFGDISIPRLYISVIGVFFTSLVLVVISTYIQLRKTVKNLKGQRSQGASDNMLLYLKDQNASRMISKLGIKTVIFLVTVLLGIVTTTNLLTPEIGMTLLIILIPFVLASISALIINRRNELKTEKKQKEDIQLPFIDSRKECSKCGETTYLSDKFCGTCGGQQIFSEIIGTYISRCSECGALINDRAKFCPNCGKDIPNKLNPEAKITKK